MKKTNKPIKLSLYIEGLKKQLIINGVKNLKEYGYPAVTEDNILKDKIYSSFFAAMLESNKGHDRDVDTAIEELILEHYKYNQ